MTNIVLYNYNRHYDFIKSDEAKDIFLNLEKEKWLKESEQYHYEEEDLKKHFSYDEEKKSIVEDFMFHCKLRHTALKIFREHEKNSTYLDFNKLKSNIIEAISSKKNIDPEYIYEHWQVEKLRFFDEMDWVCDYGDSEVFSCYEFIFDSLELQEQKQI